MATAEPTVAALYVLERGPYSRMDDVDPWPKRRDAQLYDGPLPVVAHPPCGPWSRSWSHACTRQDPALAPLAVGQLREWGGVLEHPKRSKIWDAAELALLGYADLALPLPPNGKHPAAVREKVGARRDAWGGFTVEVRMCDFGGISKKPTWVYMVGIDPASVVLPPRRDPPPPKRVMGPRGRLLCAMDLASPEGRKRSPSDFARWLVDLAATARR